MRLEEADVHGVGTKETDLHAGRGDDGADVGDDDVAEDLVDEPVVADVAAVGHVLDRHAVVEVLLVLGRLDLDAPVGLVLRRRAALAAARARAQPVRARVLVVAGLLRFALGRHVRLPPTTTTTTTTTTSKTTLPSEGDSGPYLVGGRLVVGLEGALVLDLLQFVLFDKVLLVGVGQVAPHLADDLADLPQLQLLVGRLHLVPHLNGTRAGQ